MLDPAHFFSGHLVSDDIQTLVNLHRVGGHDAAFGRKNGCILGGGGE